MDNIYQKGGYRDKGDMLTANIVNTSAHKKSDDWNKMIKKHNEKQTAAPKMASPLEYAPFKMKAASHGNSPMRKNFGIGDSEMPIKTAPVKLAVSRIRGQSQNKAQQMMAKNPGVMDPMGMGGGMGAVDMSDSSAPQVEQPVADGGGGGGAIPPHGPEAHTGGAAPIGGAEKPGGAAGGIFAKMKQGLTPRAGAAESAAGGGFMKQFGNMFSDIRLKEKIERTGASASGIPIYEFNYIGSNDRYSGAMAQDLLEINPDAVTMDTSGYYKVNYNNIDVDMHLIN